MNQQQHAVWRTDALDALNRRFTAEESKIVIEWFDRIKGADERDLTSNEFQEGLNVIRHVRAELGAEHDLYIDMMMRVWMYAPLIIAEWRDCMARGLPYLKLAAQ